VGTVQIIDLGRIARSVSAMSDVAATRKLRAGKHDARGMDAALERSIKAVDRVASQAGALPQASEGVRLLQAAATAMQDARGIVGGQLARAGSAPFGRLRIDAAEAAGLLSGAASTIRQADAALLAIPGIERLSAASSSLLLKGAERSVAASRAAGMARPGGAVERAPEISHWVDVAHWRAPQRLLTAAARPLLDRRYGLVVHGAHNVPSTGAALVVGTHGSVGDSLKYGNHLGRPYRVMAAEYWFANPAASAFFRQIGGFPVDRAGGAAAASSLEIGRGVLESGQALVMFPEGIVANLPHILEPKAGAALLALQTGAPVVPSAAFGLQPRFARSGVEQGARGAHLVFGEPLLFRQSATPGREQVREAQELIQQRQEELFDSARALYTAPSP
jgi:1-acyl-sn-glycerol-3-phosphate acyltransferase